MTVPLRPRDFHDHDDDEGGGGRKSSFNDFDCPSCSANNPTADPFAPGDEVLCNYCGTEFRVKISDEGRLQLKEI